MSATRHIHSRSIAVIVMAFIAGLVAYPRLPGPFLEHALFARVLVAFGLPATAAVGVRTKQTLADGQLWSQIHRVGGYVTVF